MIFVVYAAKKYGLFDIIKVINNISSISNLEVQVFFSSLLVEILEASFCLYSFKLVLFLLFSHFLCDTYIV